MRKAGGRQLVSCDEAVRATEQHEDPCSDCPWSRESLHGWLGTRSAAEWLQSAHGEDLIYCHTLLGAQCAGAAIYRRNVCKVPRDQEALQLPADKRAVFASPSEFLQHHEEEGA